MPLLIVFKYYVTYRLIAEQIDRRAGGEGPTRQVTVGWRALTAYGDSRLP